MVDREIFCGDVKPTVPVLCLDCQRPCLAEFYISCQEWLSDCCGSDMTERMFCAICKLEFVDFPEESEQGEAICSNCFECLKGV